VLPQCLGPISRWEGLLLAQRKLGYRLFHLSPPQLYREHGFSLTSPEELHPGLFPEGTDPAARMEVLEKTVKGLDQLYGIGCVVDVVVSHLDAEAPFWQTHPEATYNLDNCRYLRVAYEVDEALARLSEDLSQGAVQGYKGNAVRTEEELQTLIGLVKRETLPALKLHEFFQMDVSAIYASFTEAQTEASVPVPSASLRFLQERGLEHFIRSHALRGEGESRQGVTVSAN